MAAWTAQHILWADLHIDLITYLTSFALLIKDIAMETMTAVKEKKSPFALAHHLGINFRKSEAAHDRNGTFVQENYEDLKQAKIFSAMVPEELGGFGWSHAEMCDFLRSTAHYSPSTALTLSMHQHLTGVTVWKYLQGKGGEELLQRIVKEQIVLISTGARDWLSSNGEMRKVDGGYELNARKAFASGSVYGDVFVTSAPYTHPIEGKQVLHFAVPRSAEGVSVESDWDTMGMRGTGSCTAVMENVFVPEGAIALARPLEGFHPIWAVVLNVAMPLIMSVYTGIAERAAEMAIEVIKKQKGSKPWATSKVGELNNTLTNVQLVLEDMVRRTNNFDFQPNDSMGHEVLTRKTIVAKGAIKTVTQAMHLIGGPGFYRRTGMEQLFRDVQAAHYHPLPEQDQLLFSGEFLLKD